MFHPHLRPGAEDPSISREKNILLTVDKVSLAWGICRADAVRSSQTYIRSLEKANLMPKTDSSLRSEGGATARLKECDTKRHETKHCELINKMKIWWSSCICYMALVTVKTDTRPTYFRRCDYACPGTDRPNERQLSLKKYRSSSMITKLSTKQMISPWSPTSAKLGLKMRSSALPRWPSALFVSAAVYQKLIFDKKRRTKRPGQSHREPVRKKENTKKHERRDKTSRSDKMVRNESKIESEECKLCNRKRSERTLKTKLPPDHIPAFAAWEL